jgi:NAD(P)-dependent dehydrogenase (short-subunit alcohol dehydrogenase family)
MALRGESPKSSPPSLASFGPTLNAVVIGAQGGIGAALVDVLAGSPAVAHVHAFARAAEERRIEGATYSSVDIESEEAIAAAAAQVRRSVGEVSLVILATGILHDGSGMQPEKSWKTIDGAAMERAFRINCTGPALAGKHFLPMLRRDSKTAFAALSARVGSIGENRLGGWYAYRASKAALNMTIKSLSIELARTRPDALCVSLHPGTVDTALSKPFQSRVPEAQLASPEAAARNLLGVLNGLSPADSGGLFAWDGTRIEF